MKCFSFLSIPHVLKCRTVLCPPLRAATFFQRHLRMETNLSQVALILLDVKRKFIVTVANMAAELSATMLGSIRPENIIHSVKGLKPK